MHTKKKEKEDKLTTRRDHRSWIRRGKNKKDVFSSLTEPKLPSEISKETNTPLQSVSKVHRAMQQRGLVERVAGDEALRTLSAEGRYWHAIMFQQEKEQRSETQNLLPEYLKRRTSTERRYEEEESFLQ